MEVSKVGRVVECALCYKTEVTLIDQLPVELAVKILEESEVS